MTTTKSRCISADDLADQCFTRDDRTLEQEERRWANEHAEKYGDRLRELMAAPECNPWLHPVKRAGNLSPYDPSLNKHPILASDYEVWPTSSAKACCRPTYH